MAEKGTLADFARVIGIAPATARQWKKRGKIVERDGGFELVAEAQREWVGIAGRDAGVTVGDLITDGSGVTSKVTGVTVDPDGGVTVVADSVQDSRLCRREGESPESHRESCAGCIALQERVAVLERDRDKLKRDARTLYEDSANDLKRFEALETEVAFLRTRLGQPDPPVVIGTTSRGPIDPPGPSWGA